MREATQQSSASRVRWGRLMLTTAFAGVTGGIAKCITFLGYRPAAGDVAEFATEAVRESAEAAVTAVTRRLVDSITDPTSRAIILSDVPYTLYRRVGNISALCSRTAISFADGFGGYLVSPDGTTIVTRYQSEQVSDINPDRFRTATGVLMIWPVLGTLWLLANLQYSDRRSQERGCMIGILSILPVLGVMLSSLLLGNLTDFAPPAETITSEGTWQALLRDSVCAELIGNLVRTGRGTVQPMSFSSSASSLAWLEYVTYFSLLVFGLLNLVARRQVAAGFTELRHRLFGRERPLLEGGGPDAPDYAAISDPGAQPTAHPGV